MPPKLSENFVMAINSLPEKYNENSYMEFIETYGTHFIKQVHMGARFACVTRFSQNGWKILMEKDINIGLAASLSGFGATGAFDKRTEEQKKIAKEFESARAETLLSVIGINYFFL